MKKLWSSSPVLFLREALLLYFSRRVPQAAASLAYFVLLTVFPVLICVSYLLGLVNIDVVSLIDQLQTVFPEAALDVVESYLVYISSHQSIGLFFAGLAAGWFSAAAAFRTVTQVIVDMYDEVSQSMLRGLVSSILFPLALLVTVRAFDYLNIPRKQVRAVTMPCFGTTDRTYRNACELTRRLGATLQEVDIREAVTVHFRDIGHDSQVHDVTYENSQARERTQVIMDIANQSGGLVIGTGDLSELALGWATYNGDHMSMYGVNASIPKTLVRHLVRYYADTCGDQALTEILLDILDTPVSPELLPPKDGEIAQKTEDLVGPYELHDFFLYYMLRAGYEPEKIYRIARKTFAGVYEDEVILKWLKNFYRRFFSQQFKRNCLPDGPKVGTVAVSPRGDLRMPSDGCARIWLDQLEYL